MRNPKLAAILVESVEENTKEKLCLIEDIMKVKRFLWSQGDKQHDEFLDDDKKAELWLSLYDMDYCQLRVINAGYETRAALLLLNKVKQLA